MQTKQMAHEMVEAVKHNKPARVVKHRVKQIMRSIEHYGQHRDANVAVAMVSMLAELPPDALATYDDDLTEIGRLFGLSAPIDIPDLVPVEANL